MSFFDRFRRLWIREGEAVFSWVVNDPDDGGAPVYLLRPSLSDDLAATLVDLAKEGQEEDFRWLAQSSGVTGVQLDELWAGTRRRVTP